MDLQDVGCGGMDWIALAQDRDWKGYVVKHNYVNWDFLMTTLDNYMFQPPTGQ